MRNPQKEVERLSGNPVWTKQGTISVVRSSIFLDLDSFPERPNGSLFMFSLEEWVRVVGIMKVYFAREKKNSKKKGGR